MNCKNNPKKKYKGTEPSPKGLGYCASSKKMKGKDGNIWIIKKASNGSKRWIKYKSDKTKSSTINTLNCSKFVFYQKKDDKGSLVFLQGLKGKKGYIYRFIKFNSFETKEIKVNDEYQLVKMKRDFVKKNYCNLSKMLLEPNNDLFKNIKTKTKGYSKFFTIAHDENPFLIYLNKNNVQIYKKDPKKYHINYYKYDTSAWMYVSFIKKYKPLDIFIGKSLRNEMTLHDEELYGEKLNGNTILIRIEKNKYVFIGETIYQFSTGNDTIKKYYSPVAHGGVAFPFAYGEKYIYFMLDHKYISYEKVPELKNKKITDIYSYYYVDKRFNGAFEDINLSKFAKEMKSVKIIHQHV